MSAPWVRRVNESITSAGRLKSKSPLKDLGAEGEGFRLWKSERSQQLPARHLVPASPNE